ncbi:CLUMA_CG009413, isoform A [Clunio marinus]|uniref:CLUMA_CG009413, isoform A n=1 Tax=Clunio marinus TaxID=568069 RepID=A0A1J1I8S5_9DIPT|nr:CLUMA_CG009413, isoform A [Clunio marinus]
MAFRKIYSTSKVIFNSIQYPQQVRSLSLSVVRFEQGKAVATKVDVKPEWERALSEAEKIIGQQTSFISLRYLMNDEVTNWGEHIRRLEGSNHPMYETAKLLFQQGHANNINKTWGLVVLLVSKMAGFATPPPAADIDSKSGLLKSQKILAEAVETTCTANDIHREGILNMQHLQYAGINLPPDSDLIFGNKMAILGGDILFGHAGMQFGKLKNHKANILLCTAGRDVADSHFIGDRDIQNNPLPSDPVKKLEEQKNNPVGFDEIPTDQIDNLKPFSLRDIMGTAENEWKLRNTLTTGSLLGKSCQGALMLANHPEELQKEAYFFGKHLFLGYQASKEFDMFMTEELPPSGRFNLVSAPVLFHLEADHSLYNEIKKGSESIDNIDYEKVHEIVRNGPGLDKTKELMNKNNLIATTLLYKFPESDARRALENIVLASEH